MKSLNWDLEFVRILIIEYSTWRSQILKKVVIAIWENRAKNMKTNRV